MTDSCSLIIPFMSQLERSDYLEAFDVPAFLYAESADAIEVSIQKKFH
jgi:hypothetical protein